MTRVKKITTKTILVRSEQIRYMKQRMPIASKKKPKLAVKPSLDKPVAMLAGSVA
jgi:hypothetical protein